MKKRIRLYPLMVLALFMGCHKSPGERVKDASNGGALGGFGSTPNFIIFSSELRSGGGAFEYPGGENQTLAFNDQSNPLSYRSIRYSWTGQPPMIGCSTFHEFAGFDLMHTAFDSTYLTTPGRDLRAAGYTRLTFYARGTLSTNTVLKIEAATPPTGNTTGSGACAFPMEGSAWTGACIGLFGQNTAYLNATNPCSNGTSGTLTSDWQFFSVPIPTIALAAVKDFFKATFIFTDPYTPAPPGQGGTVYFDQIQYQP
ncbi:MAG: hypothetical protein WC859_10170 [Elusimicrobiota bacterium]|jgi:hypothetical protein